MELGGSNPLLADFTGTQKAAILLIALGPEKSSAIFKHLKEEEIEELTLEIANTRSVTSQIKEAILEEFYGVCLAQQYIAEGGINYAKELLEKALGEDKALDVISKLTASLQVKPFEFIRKTEPSQILTFIQDEHPQTIALILSFTGSFNAFSNSFNESAATSGYDVVSNTIQPVLLLTTVKFAISSPLT